MMKFRERFMMGEVPFDDIFSLTDKWNFSDEACTLREYLGLTAKEEDVWISDSDDALEELMEKEKNTKAVFLDLDGTLFQLFQFLLSALLLHFQGRQDALAAIPLALGL